MTNIKYITDKDFDNATLKHDGLCLEECVNGNRGQLQMMQPVVSRLTDSAPKNLKHMRIDIHKYTLIVEQFYVLQSPSYLFFLMGNLSIGWMGLFLITIFQKG